MHDGQGLAANDGTGSFHFIALLVRNLEFQTTTELTNCADTHEEQVCVQRSLQPFLHTIRTFRRVRKIAKSDY